MLKLSWDKSTNTVKVLSRTISLPPNGTEERLSMFQT